MTDWRVSEFETHSSSNSTFLFNPAPARIFRADDKNSVSHLVCQTSNMHEPIIIFIGIGYFVEMNVALVHTISSSIVRFVHIKY